MTQIHRSIRERPSPVSLRAALALAATLTASTLAVSSLTACGEYDALAGRGEPIIVPGATFHLGPLPESNPDGPQVTAVESAGGAIRRGQSGRTLSGRTSPDGYSIAVQFDELGTGYWVLPVEGPEPTANDELAWRFEAEFAHDLPVGRHRLRFVAFDENGVAGPAREMSVCVRPDFPDNLNACDATLRPPAAVVLLEWNADADLDLLVRTPEGAFVSAKKPTSAAVVDGVVPSASLEDPTLARFDVDSNGECRVDGRRRETIRWEEAPEGIWSIYTNLFDACDRPSVQFRVTVLRREALEDGTYRLTETTVREGQWTSVQASGGAQPPLFVTSIEF